MSSEEESNRMFPVNAISTGEQEASFEESRNGARADTQIVTTNIYGANSVGCPPLMRVKLTLESGITEDVKYVLNQLVMQSNQSPGKVSLKTEYDFLPDHLLDLLESDEIAMDMKIDSLLIIRNVIQSIDNCQIFSLNFRLREVLIKILNQFTDNEMSISLFDKEQIQEMVKFSLDIIENISSYLSPVSKDDPIFKKLITIFKSNENKYISITILRSIARYLYNSSESTNDASSLIDEAFLSKTVGFLLLSINEYDIDDEIILTSLDFLIQYLSIKESNMKLLIHDYNRSAILTKLLPRLLVYKQNYKTEYDQKQFLRIYKRQDDPLNTVIPQLEKTSELYQSLNSLVEPNRAHAWMRCCFKPNKNGSLTQIELWRGYESQFEKDSQLSAVVFIRNVQSAFPQSTAKVVTIEGEKKFIIQGVEPRLEPVNIETGKQDALRGEDEVEYVNRGLDQSEQVKLDLFNYGFNDYLKLNEINQSTVSLMKQMIAYDSGLQILQGHRFELLEKAISLPDLMGPILEMVDAMST